VQWIHPDEASDADVLTVHDRVFVDTVKVASEGRTVGDLKRFGLGTGDVPIFSEMHDAAKCVAGGGLAAAQHILDGGRGPILQLGGGLHHAMRDRAAGFCVYNDVAMLICRLRRDNLRVAYVDVDVHHGDGVQSIFYDDPNVLTISLHESGKYLFPGTGVIQERGRGAGSGMAVNVPLHPGTGDESYLEVFDAIVPAELQKFSPDVIVVEAGADAHFLDPLAHLLLTTRVYGQIFRRLVELADSFAGSRLIATLGGGYDFDPTMRIWTILAYKLARSSLPEHVPREWATRWEATLGKSLQSSLHDRRQFLRHEDRIRWAAEANGQTVDALRGLLA